MTIEGIKDHVRTYSPDEDEQLARQLRSVTEDCRAGRLWPISLAGLREMHRRLLEGVRDHSGKPRGHAFGDEHLTFGSNRSVHRGHVLIDLMLQLIG
ncbi:MAG TPA: hypothetical protein VH165_05435 [Kofleriaceae bacterium]|nr:hypothetical protein [Kofleriaceae bacterium]